MLYAKALSIIAALVVGGALAAGNAPLLVVAGLSGALVVVGIVAGALLSERVGGRRERIVARLDQIAAIHRGR